MTTVQHPHAAPPPLSTPQGGPSRVPVAIISNVQAPYRLHLHRRLAAEIPEIQLWSLFTHDQPDQPFQLGDAPEINPVLFGPGHSCIGQSRPRYQPREWAKAGRIIAWLKAHGVRAVVICGYNDAGRLRLIRWCHARRLPCFLVADSNARLDTARGLRLAVKRAVVGRVVRWCTGVMPCGRLGADYFLRYGARPERLFVFPLEPDYALVENLPTAIIDRAKAKFGLQPRGSGAERRRLVFCGRLAPVKRVDLAIDAFAAIAHERPDWDLVIIGDGPIRRELEARVPPALRQRVIWTGFVADQATISAIYRASDALVLPSDYEPWALVINEAAAAGLALIASDVVGAASELVEDGVNGRRFPRSDLGVLIAALREVTAPDRIDTMRAASRTVLARWRHDADPVQGFRSALRFAGVLRG